MRKTDVVIIGAGPSGALASKLLHAKGISTIVLERAQFPRFSIGESLLPQAMVYLEQAGMLDDVVNEGFQYKDGAVFLENGNKSTFDFRKKSSEGPGTTFQVQRARFDQILADNASAAGVEIRYQEEITAVDMDGPSPIVTAKNQAGETLQYQAKYVLDASGFGRVLPRMLDLETPSSFPSRQSLFTHVEDNITDPDYDRHKITIAIHPEHEDVWFWLIPFSNGRASIGVVAEESFFTSYEGDPQEKLQTILKQTPSLSALLTNAVFDTRVNQISGYSANVKSLWGNNYALLGNAGEFLDPIFSSGVTIAMKSASLIVPLVEKHLKGETVDWQKDYADELQLGVNTFRAYVESWYNGDLQKVIFFEKPTENVKLSICSILAGYAWDTTNPFVKRPKKRIETLAGLCEATT
ncbi:p-hydroxybenzoate hydroxylase [BD1-7 clade bacterium]|uniref:p-hydroxybenzoate hydroxylase n=1 Tax=BD1-7 clade bacterium TaxID=2029982 RepID=A0A5S9QCY6_9GAMM|nr:p-hydroxybenzoate hydroxylase [BD1-7 clade bacterium]